MTALLQSQPEILAHFGITGIRPLAQKLEMGTPTIVTNANYFEHEHVVMNPTPAGMRHHHLHLYVDSKNLLDRVSSSKRRVFKHRCIRFTMLASSHYRNVSKQTTRNSSSVGVKHLIPIRLTDTGTYFGWGFSNLSAINLVFQLSEKYNSIITVFQPVITLDEIERLPVYGFYDVSGLGTESSSSIFLHSDVHGREDCGGVSVCIFVEEFIQLEDGLIASHGWLERVFFIDFVVAFIPFPFGDREMIEMTS
ncbi:hypothetical protein Tco_1003407 [Tanacetum coccineum]|uniref:Uncharacterized protein n=1 Tax=Tanacetum coccineum TaxID=301880 RepID=A0ABQ5F9Y4_9ASTR